MFVPAAVPQVSVPAVRTAADVDRQRAGPGGKSAAAAVPLELFEPEVAKTAVNVPACCCWPATRRR